MGIVPNVVLYLDLWTLFNQLMLNVQNVKRKSQSANLVRIGVVIVAENF